VIIRNLGKVVECEECAHRLRSQGVLDVIEITIGHRRLHLCAEHLAELLVLGRSSLPRDRRERLAS
jgi:hypothetical protein